MTPNGESIRQRIRKAVSSQKQLTITVLSSLLAIHDDLGYLPPEAIDEVAASANTTINEVWGVASFYTNFRFEPPGEHVLEVCWGPTCHLSGAPRILSSVQSALGLTGEGDTENKRLTLRYNTCLGACSQAPVVSIDNRLVGRVTCESARRLAAESARDKS